MRVPNRAAQRILIAVLATAPLLPILRAGFMYDDTTVIRDNPLLRGWSALGRIWGTPYWPAEGIDSLGLYRPLHLALLSLVWNISGGAPRGFHLYALALAAVAALAIWWVLRRGVGVAAALLAAAWFAAHPLHVETVASAANTSELVMVLCTVSLTALLVSTEATPMSPARDWARALPFGLLAAAALAAKESGLLAVPVAAITAWGWQASTVNPTPLRRVLRDNTRMWAAAIVCVGAMILARLIVLGAPVSHGSIAAQGLGALSGPERVVQMLSLWPRVVSMLLWPTQLAPYYGPTVFPAHAGALAALSVTVGIGMLGIAMNAARRGDARPLVAGSWVLLTWLPASNLLTATGQILSDRALFGATVGVAMLIAWLLDILPRAMRGAAIVVVALMIARSAVSSTHYAIAWTSHRALWTRLAEVSPDEHLSYKLLGMDARARGDTTNALLWLARASAMAPMDRQIRFEYGQVLYTTSRHGQAVATLAPLIRDGDVRAEPAFVALYLDAVGRAAGPDAVITAARALMRSESAHVAALFLGVAFETVGRPAEARSAYAAGLRRNPGDSALIARLGALRR